MLLGIAAAIALVAGAALIGLGAFVLLRRPNSDGGKLSFPGITIESPKAGLPVMALGAVLCLSTLTVVANGGTNQPAEADATESGSSSTTESSRQSERDGEESTAPTDSSATPVATTTTSSPSPATTRPTTTEIFVSPAEAPTDQPITVSIRGQGFASEERIRLQFSEDEFSCGYLACVDLADVHADTSGNFDLQVEVNPDYIVLTCYAYINAYGQTSGQEATQPFYNRGQC